MPEPITPKEPPPRMFLWGVLTVLLAFAAAVLRQSEPGSVLAVSFYKAHLMALGGWCGYWLDRALFPYDRPHEYLELEPPCEPTALEAAEVATLTVCAGASFGHSMLRRAIVVAACLVCVGLGA